MKLSLSELGLLTLQDFEDMCTAWVGKLDKQSGNIATGPYKGVKFANKEDLKKLFPR